MVLLTVASLDDEEIEEEFGDTGVFNTSDESGMLELPGDGRVWWVVVVVVVVVATVGSQSDNKKVLLLM